MLSKRGAFEFPGFEQIDEYDNGHYHYVVGRLQVCDTYLHFRLKRPTNTNLCYLVNAVERWSPDRDMVVWEYNPRNHWRCYLAHTDCGDVLALTDRRLKNECVCEVIPLTFLIDRKHLTPFRLLTMKVQSADYLGCMYALTFSEGRVVKEFTSRSERHNMHA